MYMDPIMPLLTGAFFVLVVVGLLLRHFRQPLIVAYLVCGVLLGPHVIGLVESAAALERLGTFGVMFLLFFVGTEIDARALLGRWRVALIGTGLQILASVGCVAVLGAFLDWPLGRVVLLGFVISLSSTAVMLKLLQQGAGEDEEVGRDVIAVSLAQDLAVVPMVIVLGVLQGGGESWAVPAGQLLGGCGLIALALVVCQREIRLPFSALLRADAELQVFVALLFLSALAVLASLLGLSAALGAFLAGMLVRAARETRRFHESLKPFEVVFVALFFVSVGMLIDLDFLRDHWGEVLGLVLLVFLTNTFVNAVVLRSLGSSWRRAMVAASYLAHVGEFSFVLAALGRQSGIIGEYGYHMTIALISLSLLASPAWIGLIKRWARPAG